MQSEKSRKSKEAEEEREECITTSSEETNEARYRWEWPGYVDKKCPFRRALLAIETVPPFETKCEGTGGAPVFVKQEESGDMNGLPSTPNESLGGGNVTLRLEGEKEEVSRPGKNPYGPYGHRSFFDEASDGEEGASPADEGEQADEMLGGSPEADVRIEAWEMVDARRSRPVHTRDVAQSLGIEAARASIVRVRQMAKYGPCFDCLFRQV
jgi:hypothetical protein